ncbi:sensor histidine kinase [Flavipsychrobacter stenotrophus]|uniref:sensor histidine kinase n=1 Tax=Flavipsychrobacter stenotrophus TaxID=2077091 RepID=UPI00196A53CE|nr:ATP-binding protein [Flavipsychrobacter stenotrophus]
MAVKEYEEDVQLPQNKLMQIAGNLISNAIKFTPRFGDVTVMLEIAATETGQKLLITVKDTGAGISKDQIIALLSDSDASTDGTDGEKGYGFGLTLVKHLVKGMNGTFNIVSEEGKGSEFVVVLPV